MASDSSTVEWHHLSDDLRRSAYNVILFMLEHPNCRLVASSPVAISETPAVAAPPPSTQDFYPAAVVTKSKEAKRKKMHSSGGAALEAAVKDIMT